MSGILRAISGFLNRDLTGKTWVSRQDHPYFGEAVYFGGKDPAQGYWEAEIAVPGMAKKISVTMTGTPEGPEPSEEAFCCSVLSDLDALFEKCRSAFLPVFTTWAEQPLPQDWRQSFALDGFDIPARGNPSMPWSVCYFVEPAGRYFTAEFIDGKVSNVQLDG